MKLYYVSFFNLEEETPYFEKKIYANSQKHALLLCVRDEDLNKNFIVDVAEQD